MGLFERDAFMESLVGVGQELGVMRLELTCRIPMGAGGGLVSSVPVLFAPALSAKERKERLGGVFDRADAWLNTHLGDRRVGTTLRVYATLYDVSDPDRNLLELAALEFVVA